MTILSGHGDVYVDKSRHSAIINAWPGLKNSFDAIEATPGFGAGFWYLMTPYTRYQEGHTMAWTHAVRVASALMVSGVTAFSPIVHSHPLVRISGGMIPMDQACWLAINRTFMDPAIGGILAELPGWDRSEGIALELEYFKQAGKTVVRLPIPASMLSTALS